MGQSKVKDVGQDNVVFAAGGTWPLSMFTPVTDSQG